MRKILVILFLLIPFTLDATTMDDLQSLRESAQSQSNFDPLQNMDTVKTNDTIWNGFVNRACIAVAADLNCIEGNTAVASVSGTRAYAVDTAILNILWTVRVENKIQVPMKQYPAAYMEEVAGDTVLAEDESPTGYWLNNDSIKFYPTPVAVDTFLVSYSIYPNFLSIDTSSTNVPLEYREAIVLYACHLFQFRMKDYQQAGLILQFYDARIAKYKADKAAHYNRPQVTQ